MKVFRYRDKEKLDVEIEKFEKYYPSLEERTHQIREIQMLRRLPNKTKKEEDERKGQRK